MAIKMASDLKESKVVVSIAKFVYWGLRNERIEAANGPATLCGVGIDIDLATGLATRIAPLRIGPRLQNVVPW